MLNIALNRYTAVVETRLKSYSTPQIGYEVNTYIDKSYGNILPLGTAFRVGAWMSLAFATLAL